MRKYKISIISLLIVCIMAITGFVANLVAFAGRDVTFTGTTIFYKTSGATINAYGVDEGSEKAYYTLFLTSKESDNLTYRKNLALYWNEGNGNQGAFNLTFGFADLSFDKYVIELQTQPYNDNKDNVSKNYIVVAPAGENTVNVFTTTDKTEIKDTTVEATATKFDMSKITLTLQARQDGSMGATNMLVTDGTNSDTLALSNIGNTYSKYYSSSNSNPCTPLSFYAMGIEENATAKFVLYSMNGQSFKYQTSTVKTEGVAQGAFPAAGVLTDDTAPVLCFTTAPSLVKYGSELNVDYVVIDVIASSPKATMYYYVLTNAQADDNNFEGNKYPQTKDQAVDKELYTEITSSKTELMLDVKDGYYPTTSQVSYFGSQFKAHGLVKVLVALTDVTTTGGETSYVFLDQYVDDEKLVEVNGVNYMVLGKDAVGATYTKYDNNGNVDKSAMQAAWDEYQAEIDKLTYDTDGKLLLKAGSSEHLYLPSAEKLFSDNLTGYEDLTFTIYYKNDSQRSNSSLDSSELNINITTDGDYTFTFFVTDEWNNDMYYVDNNGEVQKFESNDVWDFFNDEDGEYTDVLPWFTFKVGYDVPTVETPGAQNIAYVGTTYSSISFDINGVSGKYTTEYTLYKFDRAEYVKDNGSITYNKFVEEDENGVTFVETLFEDAQSRSKYFTTITPLSKLTDEEKDEDSDNYNEMAAYAWNGSSSFVPQDENAFYVVRLEVEDNVYHKQVVKYMAINSTKEAKQLEGENDWLKNNVVSIVLLSIAGACFIALVVLFILGRSKKDIDEEVVVTRSKRE